MIQKIKQKFQKEEHKRLFSNFISLSILQGANYLLPLITFPYLVRVLGVEKFGLIMFAQSFIIFFNIIVDFGFNLSAVREVSIYRDNQKKLTEIFSSVMTIKLILILFSMILLATIVFTFDKFKDDKLLYFLTFIAVIGQAMIPIWYFQGIEKMKYITLINVISKIFFTLAIFIFIHQQSDYLLFPLFNGVGFIMGGILSLYLLHTRFHQKFEFQNITKLIKYFKESYDFFLSRLAVSIYTSANTFVLGLFTNHTIVGYYSIAEKLYIAYQSFFQPLIQTIYPYISKYKDISKFKKIYFYVLGINLLLLFFIYNMAPDFIYLVAGKEVSQSIEAFKQFLLVLFFVIPSILVGYPFLAALGYKRYANHSVIIGSLIHFCILFFLAFLHKVTIFNIIWSVLITEVSIFIMRHYAIVKFNLFKEQ